MKLKQLILIVGGLVLLAAILCGGGSLITALRSQNATPTPEGEENAPAASLSIRARGEVVPAVWADLSFDTSGSFVEWAVEEGEVVAAGTPLGWLDTSDLQRAAEQAEYNLQQASLRLERLQQPADESNLMQAQHAVDQAAAALEIAQLNLEAILNNTLLTDALEDARQVVEDKQHIYEGTLADYESGRIDYWFVDQARQAYEQALQELTRLQQQADLQMETARNEVDQARRNLQEAEDRLAQLLEGTDPLDLEAARLEVEAAQLALEEAASRLEEATLIAPFDGTVVTLHLRPHDRIQPGVPAVTLADLSTLRVETTDMDEWGAAQISVGDEAEVVFNAFDDKTLGGRVSAIDLRGERLPAGDVVYRVIIELDEPDPELRWGMTVRVSIPLEEPPQ